MQRAEDTRHGLRTLWGKEVDRLIESGNIKAIIEILENSGIFGNDLIARACIYIDLELRPHTNSINDTQQLSRKDRSQVFYDALSKPNTKFSGDYILRRLIRLAKEFTESKGMISFSNTIDSTELEAIIFDIQNVGTLRIDCRIRLAESLFEGNLERLYKQFYKLHPLPDPKFENLFFVHLRELLNQQQYKPAIPPRMERKIKYEVPDELKVEVIAAILESMVCEGPTSLRLFLAQTRHAFHAGKIDQKNQDHRERVNLLLGYFLSLNNAPFDLIHLLVALAKQYSSLDARCINLMTIARDLQADSKIHTNIDFGPNLEITGSPLRVKQVHDSSNED